jgi:hypothetical protein
MGSEDIPKGAEDVLSGSLPEVGLTREAGEDPGTPQSLTLPKCSHSLELVRGLALTELTRQIKVSPSGQSSVIADPTPSALETEIVQASTG